MNNANTCVMKHFGLLIVFGAMLFEIDISCSNWSNDLRPNLYSYLGTSKKRSCCGNGKGCREKKENSLKADYNADIENDVYLVNTNHGLKNKHVLDNNIYNSQVSDNILCASSVLAESQVQKGADLNVESKQCVGQLQKISEDIKLDYDGMNKVLSDNNFSINDHINELKKEFQTSDEVKYFHIINNLNINTRYTILISCAENLVSMIWCYSDREKIEKLRPYILAAENFLKLYTDYVPITSCTYGQYDVEAAIEYGRGAVSDYDRYEDEINKLITVLKLQC